MTALKAVTRRLGARIRSLREGRKMHAIDVAAKLRCDPSHYYAIERGAHAPSLALVVGIARVLKVDVAVLFSQPTLCRWSTTNWCEGQ